MRFGINTFLFACPFTNRSTRFFPKFKEWGFDTVEISVEKLDHIDPAYFNAKLAAHGLVCGSVTPCLGPHQDLRGTPQQQSAALEHMKAVIDLLGKIGAASLIGVVYSTVGRTESVPKKEQRRQWKTVAKNLKDLSVYAESKGRFIAMEPINRFETDFINTCDQGLNMIHDVDHPALKLHLDTFHMNIEEKDSAAAIRKAGKHLGHLHACGCDRGTPGNDHIDWKGIAAALKAIKYDGDVVIESFSRDFQSLAKAASIWRDIEPTNEEIAWKGLRFLKGVLGRKVV